MWFSGWWGAHPELCPAQGGGTGHSQGGSRILWTSHRTPWAQRGAHGFSLSREEFSLGGSCPQFAQMTPQPCMSTLRSSPLTPETALFFPWLCACCAIKRWKRMGLSPVPESWTGLSPWDRTPPAPDSRVFCGQTSSCPALESQEGSRGSASLSREIPWLLPDPQEECFPLAGSDKGQEGELLSVSGSSLEVSTLNISPLSAP